MTLQYHPTADVEVLLDALRGHTNVDRYDALAEAENDLKQNMADLKAAEANLQYRTSKVEDSKIKVAKGRRKVAQLINALIKAGCPEVEIRKQWQDYNGKYILPWPNGHDLAEWIKEGK